MKMVTAHWIGRGFVLGGVALTLSALAPREAFAQG